MSELVSYQLKDSIATISMDDGKANVLSLDMLGQINNALDQAAADRAVVVLTGREGIFTGGFDLRALGTGDTTAASMLTAGFRLAERLLSFPMPTIIACNGHAIAMGVFLLLSADYRIGAAGPYKITANEVAIGLTMPRTAVEICRQRLAPAHFHRAVILAEVYSPDNAVAAGFMDRTVSGSDLLGEARTIATGLSKLNMDAHKATKLRARDPALTKIRAAIESDQTAFQAMAASAG